MAKQKLIYDCDPGHDDAVALMLAANSPELELLGVTAASGNQTLENTARNACRVLQWLGREEIPVYAGCGRPMVREQLTAGDIHGETGLDGPVFPPLRKAAEFNILADPEAAHVCFTAGRPVTMIGLDVTRKVLCYPDIVARMAQVNTSASRLFVDLMGHFCRTQKEIYGWEGGPLHDPVTIACLLDPDLVVTKPMHVEIDLSGGPSYGRTNCDAFGYLGLPATADVAVDIDVPRFWDLIEAGLRRYAGMGDGI